MEPDNYPEGISRFNPPWEQDDEELEDEVEASEDNEEEDHE